MPGNSLDNNGGDVDAEVDGANEVLITEPQINGSGEKALLDDTSKPNATTDAVTPSKEAAPKEDKEEVPKEDKGFAKNPFESLSDTIDKARLEFLAKWEAKLELMQAELSFIQDKIKEIRNFQHEDNNVIIELLQKIIFEAQEKLLQEKKLSTDIATILQNIELLEAAHKGILLELDTNKAVLISQDQDPERMKIDIQEVYQENQIELYELAIRSLREFAYGLWAELSRQTEAKIQEAETEIARVQRPVHRVELKFAPETLDTAKKRLLLIIEAILGIPKIINHIKLRLRNLDASATNAETQSNNFIHYMAFFQYIANRTAERIWIELQKTCDEAKLRKICDQNPRERLIYEQEKAGQVSLLMHKLHPNLDVKEAFVCTREIARAFCLMRFVPTNEGEQTQCLNALRIYYQCLLDYSQLDVVNSMQDGNIILVHNLPNVQTSQFQDLTSIFVDDLQFLVDALTIAWTPARKQYVFNIAEKIGIVENADGTLSSHTQPAVQAQSQACQTLFKTLCDQTVGDEIIAPEVITSINEAQRVLSRLQDITAAAVAETAKIQQEYHIALAELNRFAEQIIELEATKEAFKTQIEQLQNECKRVTDELTNARFAHDGSEAKVHELQKNLHDKDVNLASINTKLRETEDQLIKAQSTLTGLNHCIITFRIAYANAGSLGRKKVVQDFLKAFQQTNLHK